VSDGELGIKSGTGIKSCVDRIGEDVPGVSETWIGLFMSCIGGVSGNSK
jgi:hypothetical protein